MAEVVVPNEATVRLATQLTELLLIHHLEQRALIPARSRKQPQIAIKLALCDVHNPDLECRISLRVEHQIVEPAPSALDPLEFRCVDDRVDLFGELGIEPGDH